MIRKDKIADWIYERNPMILKDIARTKKKLKLYSRYLLRETYRILTFYRLRKATLCYPKTLQLPITNRCNLDCVMCNIQSKECKKEISLEDFEKMLKDPIFREIRSVGINGGEPFLVKDICERVSLMIKCLPKLQNIYIISNGILTELIDRKLQEVKQICDKGNKTLTVSISLDGIGEVHDEVRALKGAYEKTVRTIQMIQENKEKYCNHFNVICTISKYNVYHLNEMEKVAKENGWPVSYNVATEHERLNNHNKYDSFSLQTDRKARAVACEFFFKKFLETESETYYSIFKFLEGDVPRRVCGCNYLKSGITITPEGDICFCATHSAKIGSIYEERSIKDIYFSNEKYNRQIKNKYCESCSHYILPDIHAKEYAEYVNLCVAKHHKYRV